MWIVTSWLTIGYSTMAPQRSIAAKRDASVSEMS
jgi:hypothetical protein